MAGALVGIYLHSVLPPDHMKEDTRQIVNVATGLIATLSALVLGLMVASAKSSFDTRAQEVRESGAQIIMLDRSLRQYGPETRETRELLRQLIEERIKRVWGPREDPIKEGSVGSQAAEIEAIRNHLFALTPRSDAQKWLHARALTLAAELEQARWLLIEHSRSSIPRAFLMVLVFWLVVIFASLGLFAPRNATVYAIIFVCTVSVATAVFLILEMDQPYAGVLQISDAPLRSALAEISR
ncbi:MAG TPA: hypothetical protein VGL25_03770 [Casimicrobiaceae bacterium]